jgi:UDP-N-acetylmuramoyl-L-alanyl-D-glutamate--2,6-diaminopimelate ligase
MQLSELIEVKDKAANVEILGLAADSREVRPGYLFAAFSGSKTDGAKYIDQAVAQGAVAVLTTPDASLDEVRGQVYRLTAANPRRRFAQLVAKFYGAQPKYIAAVTGTNGKTSVASFTRQIWGVLGHKAGSIGTLGVVSQGYNEPATLTTPDPIALHHALAELAKSGVDHLALEASSHGLAQYRLDGVKVMAAAFTNLTRDHLDYHGSEEDYFYAKARLFGEVMAPGGVAVLNLEQPFYPELENLCWARGHRIISVGTVGGDIRLVASAPTLGGQHLTVSYLSQIHEIDLPLSGGFQALNALTAAALVIGCGGDPARALSALSKLEPVPGRLEKVADIRNGAAVFVDYAHTPDALVTILRALRPHAAGALHVLFGCGGDRDRGKRPLMGEIAAAYADKVYVTDDNPRSEDAATIRREVMAGCPKATEIGDRRQAIRAALAGLQAGDVLVVAGKGHEEGQIIGNETIPFSDVMEVKAAVKISAREGSHGA